MGAHAIAIRREDHTLALLLRVVRSPSGIYVVFAAGQDRRGHNPHSSWHRDGRVHHKSFGREFMRRKRQAIGGFTGVEPFIMTSTTRAAAPYLPACNPMDFESVMEVPVQILNDPPNGTQVHVELVALDAEPAVLAFKHRLLQRAELRDAAPLVVVSLYDVPVPTAESSR